jgi:hypothetical protein
MQFLARLTPFYLFICGMAILMGLGSLFVNAVVTSMTFNKARNDVKPLGSVLGNVVSKLFIPLILQALLVGVIITGMTAVFIIVFAVFVFAFASQGAGAVFILLAVLGYLAFICLIVWFTTSVTFAPESIVFERLTATGSISKSFFLLRGSWWRVFGLLLLVGIMLSFASSIVIGPIVFIPLLPPYLKMLTSFFESGSENFSENYLSSIVELLRNIQIPMFIGMVLGSILESMVMPVFRGLFYIDLKVRKNELEEPQPDSPIEAPEGECTEDPGTPEKTGGEGGNSANDGQ